MLRARPYPWRVDGALQQCSCILQVTNAMVCAGSPSSDGAQKHIVEEHQSMFLARCQEAKSLGRAINAHKQVGSDIQPCV
jgi:hypothetical protein